MYRDRASRDSNAFANASTALSSFADGADAGADADAGVVDGRGSPAAAAATQLHVASNPQMTTIRIFIRQPPPSHSGTARTSANGTRSVSVQIRPAGSAPPSP